MPTPSKSAVLLLGGTGKIASRIAPLLSSSGRTTLLASRRGASKTSLPNVHGIKFDWFDDSTWSTLFTSNPNIGAIFIVGPPVLDCFPVMKRFIDLALSFSVERLVLLSGSLIDVGDGPTLSEVSGYVAERDVEYAILRPSWFMENFSEQEHLPTIRDADSISTATGEGKVPFISAEDIATVAYHALTDAKAHNTDHLILGPEVFSYDEIAEMFTKALGRKITHVKITEDQVAADMEHWGVPADYARMLATLDTAIKEGKENRLNDVVLEVTGKPPKKFEIYLGECVARGVWDKKKEQI